MIAKPPIDQLTELAGNKYALCCAVSKRAKELTQLQKKDELSTDVKTISYASDELICGDVEFKK